MSGRPARLLPVSVIIVSDYEAGSKTWADELACVTAIAGDQTAIPSQILIMAGPFERASVPPPHALRSIQNCEVIFTALNSSTGLKNRGLALSINQLVAIVEADCLPEPGWLSLLYDFISEHPRCDVVSGRTVYQGTGTLRRVMSLIDRGYLEYPSKAGGLEHYSANGALFRRKLFDAVPLPESASPFVAVHRHHIMLQRVGANFAIEKRAVIRHAFPSASFIWDVRRNKGHQFATLAGNRAGGALERARRSLKIARSSFSRELKISCYLFASYCRWWDIWLWYIMMFYVRLPEISGAFAARDDGGPLNATAYK